MYVLGESKKSKSDYKQMIMDFIIESETGIKAFMIRCRQTQYWLSEENKKVHTVE